MVAVPYKKGPWTKIVAANASDSADLTHGVCTGLLVGTAGAASVVDACGNAAALIPLQVGYNHIAVKRILATGLTAANIWVLY